MIRSIELLHPESAEKPWLEAFTASVVAPSTRSRMAAVIQKPSPRALRFESPQLHQEVAANRPGFPAPTIPRLFSALARRLIVCGVHSAGTTDLGRRTRKNRVSDAEFWVPDRAAGRISEIANRSDCNQRSTGALSPNADHWSGQAIGRSIRRLTPKPRGSRPSIAALTRAGQTKASSAACDNETSTLAKSRSYNCRAARFVPSDAGARSAS